MYSQYSLPFLTISPSGEANGAGGILSSSSTTNPAAMIFNPAQLGFLSRTMAAGTEFYLQKTPMSIGFPVDNQSFHSFSAMAGYRLASMSIGAGYSRIVIDYGTWKLTSASNPRETKSFRFYETSDNISFGLGFQLGAVDAAFGFTFKQITSHLPGSSSAGLLTDLVAKPMATDLGLIVKLPVMNLFNTDESSIDDGFIPFVDITTAFALNNFGDEVSYSAGGQSDPLPELVRLGWSAIAGYRSHPHNQPFTIVSLQISREAEESMISRNPNGSVHYKSLPVSEMNIYQSLIAGRYYNAIPVRKGLSLSLFETLTIGVGSHQYTTFDNYSTSGFTVSTNGVFMLLQRMSGSEDSVISTLNRCEIRFTRSQYSGTSSPYGIDTFYSFVFILRH